MKKFSTFFSIIKIPFDFLLTVAAFMSAYQIRLATEISFAKPIDFSNLPTEQEYFYYSLIAAAALTFIFAARRSYSIHHRLNLSQETKELLFNWIIWVMAIITFYFITRTLPFSRLAIFYSWGLTFLFLFGSRLILKIVQDIFNLKGIGQTNLLLIGKNQIAKTISKNLKNNSGYKIIGILENAEELGKIIKQYRIDEIIQTQSDLKSLSDEEILEFCELNHISYRFTPDLVAVRRTHIKIETLSGIPIISLNPTPLEGWGKVLKRLSDIIGSTLGLILLSPIFLITAIAIKLDSKGPIFFTKLDDGSPAQRIGQKSQKFVCYKFRSMHPNTHNQRYKELKEKNTRNEGPLIKIKQDPRVTRVGKIIRKYSIDELPQLFNVLLGNMSLVGPRPHLPEEVAKYQNHHRFVLTIKPGLTGMAQISGRSDLSFEEEVKLDRYYIENWSLLLDLKIIFKTISVVLKGHEE